MNRPISSFLKSCRAVALVTVISISLFGCAHEISTIKKVATVPAVTPVAFAPTATAVEEIAIQTDMTAKAYDRQVDVLAPIHFDESRIILEKANQESKRGASDVEILKTIGFARAHLNKANQDAKVTQTMVSAVANARLQAIKAGAKKSPAGLSPLDDQFKKITISALAGNARPETETLQNQYLALELSCIKTAKLENVQMLMAQARAKNAETITPSAYNESMQTYSAAEKLIETDRHSNQKIDAAVKVATVAAKRTLSLLLSEQNSRGQTPEQRAVTLESRDHALKEADSTISQVAAIAIQKNDELAARNASLAASEGENKELKRKEHNDKVVANAAAMFTENEAEVYRKEDLLIIRLRTMDFASGRSDLPSNSMVILNKVKEVIREIGPGKVTVEGHTDAIGAAATNQKLSQDRAQSVMKYFTADKMLENNQIDSIGYGFSKPLATNKTKEGRAQNRRVDIVIKPSQVL